MKNLNFVALDFETANSNYVSICQIGIVVFKNGEIVEKVSQLIDPKTYFAPEYIGKHGISESDVQGKPTFKQFFETLNSYLQDQIVAHHQPFEFVAYHQACEYYELNPVACSWLDVGKVVRRLWAGFQYKGYGLENIAGHLGIIYEPHDACEDAGAAGQVLIAACQQSDQSLKEWLRRIKWKINKNRLIEIQPAGTIIKKPEKILPVVTGDPENPFYGKRVVVSGNYNTWPNRDDLIEILQTKGANVSTGISGVTNILCVGEDAGPMKIKKMQKNIDAGKDAKIITEKEIIKMLQPPKKNKTTSAKTDTKKKSSWLHTLLKK